LLNWVTTVCRRGWSLSDVDLASDWDVGWVDAIRTDAWRDPRSRYAIASLYRIYGNTVVGELSLLLLQGFKFWVQVVLICFSKRKKHSHLFKHIRQIRRLKS
jgi:hypothetical protein